MANNYTLFSQTIDDLTPEEEEWAAKALSEPEEGEGSEEDSIYREILDDSPSMEFSWEITSLDGGRALVFWSDDSGNTDQVAKFAQLFLKKFRPKGHFFIEWANTCSKPRPGEFGGGVVFVTADDITYTNTSNWVDEKVHAWKSRGGE